MERKRALNWAGKYFLLTTVLGLVGITLVAIGGYVAYTQASGSLYGFPRPTVRSLVGLVPILLGIVVWRAGKAWALYLTLTGAMEDELGDTFDTEHVKSDIVAVLDDRLADMQQDLQSVNREIRNLKDKGEFDFSQDD